MKKQITNEQQVTERPMNILKKGIAKLGTKLPGSYGAKMQGKLDTGTVANQLYKDYFTYLGRIGQKPDTENLKSFLKTKGADREIDIDAAVGLSETPLGRSQLGKIFMNVAQKLASSGSAPTGGSDTAATSGDTAAAAQAAPQAKPSAMSRFGQTVKTAIGKAWDKTKTPAPQAAAPQGDIQVDPATQGGFKTAILKPQAAPQLDPGSQGGFKKSITPPAAGTKFEPAWKKKAKTMSPVTRTSTIKMPDTKFSESKMLRALAKAIATGEGMPREQYFVATKILEHYGMNLKDLGIRVVLSESTKDVVKLKKI